ncbi:MAG: CBS domain-containing protein [Comamonadaceae bacterium]|jgi:CBS domain-containing protein
MFEQSIKNLMERKKFLTASLETTVRQAAKLMASKNVGAILVVENEQLVGIFSERDVVFRVVAKGLDPKTTALSQVMTSDPKTLEPGRSYGHALLLMQENGFRHVPVVENGKPIGIVSSRNAMDPDLEEFVFEERRREHHR